MQVGPVIDAHMPKDKISGTHQSYGFVEFRTEEDADYAVKVLSMTKLYSKSLRVTKASADKARVEIGANLFIGNLAPEVDEKVLYDTFSAFGLMVMPPKVMRDPESGVPKGFGFVNFDSFEASDLAIECMNGQFLGSRQVVVQYAFKRDSVGERHGGMAERLLAASRPGAGSSTGRPHTLFATAPGQVSSIVPATAMVGQGGGSYGGAAPPQMLPPAAILPASMAPPPLPPPPSLGQPMLPPAGSAPPLPGHMMFSGGQPPPLPPPGMFQGGQQMPPPLPPPGMMFQGGMMPPPLPPPGVMFSGGQPMPPPPGMLFQGGLPLPPPLPPPGMMFSGGPMPAGMFPGGQIPPPLPPPPGFAW